MTVSVGSGVSAEAALGPLGRPLLGLLGRGAVMVSDQLVQRWELAYRRYGDVSESVAFAVAGDRDVAASMATASWDVAVSWRNLAAEGGIPWWALAAVGAAAQSFEFQARDWNARASHEGSASGATRPHVPAVPRGGRVRSRGAEEAKPRGGDQSW